MSKVLDVKKIPLSSLKEWKDNPRSITKEDFNRLKTQIKNLGVYQPLVVNEDMIVLSGNMRLKAFREMNINPVMVVIVEAKTKAKMIEYALSANDQAGSYEEEDLCDLLLHADEEIPLEDYKITVGDVSLDKLLKKFGPGDEFTTEEPEKEKKKVTCPECGHEFTP